MLNMKLVEMLKATGLPYYEIAWRAGLKPPQLYKITAGIDRPGPKDRRIQALSRFLGIPAEEVLKPFHSEGDGE